MATRAQQDAHHQEVVSAYYETGDEAPLGLVVEELRPRLLALAQCTFGVRQVEQAEDIVQETLSWLLDHLRAGDYLGTGTVAAYAGSHLRFVYLNSRRTNPSQPGPDEDPFRTLALATAPAEPEQQQAAEAVLTAATQAVLGLDPSARAAVVLYFYHGLPATDAAQQLGIAEAAFRQRLGRGLTALQAWGRTVARPAAEVYAALSGVDSGDLFREPLRLTE